MLKELPTKSNSLRNNISYSIDATTYFFEKSDNKDDDDNNIYNI